MSLHALTQSISIRLSQRFETKDPFDFVFAVDKLVALDIAGEVSQKGAVHVLELFDSHRVVNQISTSRIRLDLYEPLAYQKRVCVHSNYLITNRFVLLLSK